MAALFFQERTNNLDTIVYFIRHGTTDSNLGGRFQGKSDIPLGSLGMEQAVCLGERFAEVPLDMVYTSPLTRARQTAEGVCTHLAIAPTLCVGLREIDGGALEGRTNAENLSDYPQVMEALRGDPSKFCPPDGETARQVHTRMEETVHQLICANAGRRIAIVSHGFALLSYLGCLDVPFEKMQPDIVANASVTCIRYHTEGGHEILFCNDQTHLPEALRVRSPFWKQRSTVNDRKRDCVCTANSEH